MLKANYGYVVVEVEKNPDMTPGGIVLPQNAIGESNRGIVTSDGDLSYSNEGKGLNGLIVFFPRYSGNKVNYGDKEYLVLKTEDILAYETKD